MGPDMSNESGGGDENGEGMHHVRVYGEIKLPKEEFSRKEAMKRAAMLVGLGELKLSYTTTGDGSTFDYSRNHE